MKKKLVIALVIFTAVAAGIFYFLTTGNVGKRYNTAQVEKGEVGRFIQDTGRVSSMNIRKYYGDSVKKVESLNVKLGEHVKNGQLLIKYEDDLDFEVRKVEKQIEALEATYSSATSGIDIENINSAKIEISRIKGNIELATKNKDRIQELYNNGAVSLVELEQVQNNIVQLDSSLAVAQNNYNQLIKGVSESTRKKYEAEIDVLLLTLESIERRRENFQVFSDIDGIATEFNTFVGDIPLAGSMIIEIQDPNAKVVLVDFMVEDALLVKPHMRALLVEQSMGVNIDNLKINRIFPKAFITMSELGVEENRQTVEIGIYNNEEELPFGLELNTRVIIDEAEESLLIPKDAVYAKNGSKYVEVIENGEPVGRRIETGIEDGSHIVVKQGLTEGEEVILRYMED